MQEILINQIQTPDGTILRSYHNNDYRNHRDKNGKIYGVQGGTERLLRSYKLIKGTIKGVDQDKDYTELSVLTYDPFEKIRLYWQPTIDKYLCELTTLELWDRCERIKYWDEFYKTTGTDSNKELYVIESSLAIQERLFRQRYKNYCKQVRRLITTYNNKSSIATSAFVGKSINIDIGKKLAQTIWESEKPFGEIQKIYEKSKYGNRIYHKIVCLVKEWMDKHSFAKVSEYETEKVLAFILKPLEER